MGCSTTPSPRDSGGDATANSDAVAHDGLVEDTTPNNDGANDIEELSDAAIITPVTSLPALPELELLDVSVRNDSVTVEVYQIDGAKDYRIYELPKEGDILVNQDGTVIVKNATYRCAGERQAPGVSADDEEDRQSSETHTTVVGEVYGYARTLQTAILGYVYPNNGANRKPVYKLGDSSPDADTGYYFQRWNETRNKEWTISTTERDAKLASRWRDDGIAFYVPDQIAGKTQPIYYDTQEDYTHAGAFGHPRNIFYTDGAEKTFYKSDAITLAFHVFKTQEPGTVPLRRVFYRGAIHDELTIGEPAFQRAYHQGNTPLSFVHWSNLSQETTLVVEALDEGCPFQGLHSAKSLAASGGYQAFVTLDDQRAASTHGDIYINGQFDGTNPKAIARTFIKVSPGTKPSMDWFESFDASYKNPTVLDPCGEPNCFARMRAVNND